MLRRLEPRVFSKVELDEIVARRVAETAAAAANNVMSTVAVDCSSSGDGTVPSVPQTDATIAGDDRSCASVERRPESQGSSAAGASIVNEGMLTACPTTTTTTTTKPSAKRGN